MLKKLALHYVTSLLLLVVYEVAFRNTCWGPFAADRALARRSVFFGMLFVWLTTMIFNRSRRLPRPQIFFLCEYAYQAHYASKAR